MSRAEAKSRIRRRLAATPLKKWILTEPRFVITGTGRCGTKYISRLLTAAGVKTGHEQWWNPLDNKASRLVGDASWCAAFNLDAYEGHVFHQVRDTIKVVESMVAVEVAPHRVDKAWPQYRRRYIDFSGDPLIDAMRITEAWLAESERLAEWTWRLEDVDADLVVALGERIGMKLRRDRVEAAMAEVPSDTNKKIDKRDDQVRITWDDLPDGELKQRLIAFATQFGYL